MITSCNHSSTEKLCGSCREKNYRQSVLDEQDARIAELVRENKKLVEAVNRSMQYTESADRELTRLRGTLPAIAELERQLVEAKRERDDANTEVGLFRAGEDRAKRQLAELREAVRNMLTLESAAPDLYAALERIYGRLLMSDRDGECRITAEEGEMAEAALKKARGEE